MKRSPQRRYRQLTATWMRPAIEVEPEWVEAHRAGKVKLPPNPPVTQETVEVVLDSDVLSFFKQIGPDWQNNLNNILRIALFRRLPEAPNQDWR